MTTLLTGLLYMCETYKRGKSIALLNIPK